MPNQPEEQLLEAENLFEDIGLLNDVTQRNDDRFRQATTAAFLAEAEQQKP